MKQTGFTLIELLIVLAIISITLATALPDFSHSLKIHRANSSTNSIYHLLIFARNQAISLNRVVTLCASSDGENCDKSKDWSNKTLLVYVDKNFDGIKDEEEVILQQLTIEPKKSSLFFHAAANKTIIQWLPSGMTNYQNGNMVYCPEDKDRLISKVIIWNVAGRPYFGKDKNKDGIAENGSSKNLSCSL